MHQWWAYHSWINLFSWYVFQAPNISPVVEVPVLLVLDLDVVQVSLPRSLPKINAKRLLLLVILFCCLVPNSNKDDGEEGEIKEEQGTAMEVDEGLHGDL
jgi:hypothetical protein